MDDNMLDLDGRHWVQSDQRLLSLWWQLRRNGDFHGILLLFPGIFLALDFLDDCLVALLVKFEALCGFGRNGLDGFLYHFVVDGQEDLFDGEPFSSVTLLPMVVDLALITERLLAKRTVVRLDV